MGKILYVLVTSLLSFTIFSCAKKSDTSSSTSNTEIEGTWQTPCHAGVSLGYYDIRKVTVSGTNWTYTTESHSDSSCTTDWGTWTSTYGSLSIGEAMVFDSYGSSGGSGHRFTFTRSNILPIHHIIRLM